MSRSPVERLEDAVYETVVEIGVGGFVPARKFMLVFKEIDASTFARIMYATDLMMSEFEGYKAVDERNILPTINSNNFEAEKHFCKVESIFRRHFGSQTLKL